MNTGTEAMPADLSFLLNGALVMKDTYDAVVYPMFHLHNPSKGEIPEGSDRPADIVAVCTEREAWMPMAISMHEQSGGGEWAGMISDAWAKQYTPETAPVDANGNHHLPVGELQRLATEENDSSVREILAGVLRYADGREYHFQQGYTEGPDNTVVLGEVTWWSTSDVQAGGWVSQVLQAVLGHRQPSVKDLLMAMDVLSGMDIHKTMVSPEDAAEWPG